MSTRKEYWCDICGEKWSEPGQLYGLRFVDSHQFEVGLARDTDGKHLCITCIEQIVQQMSALVDEITRPV